MLDKNLAVYKMKNTQEPASNLKRILQEDEMLALLLVVTGIIFRFLPHAPNFSPVAAIALFAAAYLPNRRQALIVPLSLMIISDLFLGMHNVIVFTWGAILLVSLIGINFRKARKTTTVLGGSLLSSFTFFIVTNLGVWMMGWYPKTAAGLMQCYIAAIPFFRNFLAGTLVYSFILFAAYEITARFVKNTRFSSVLLTS